MKSIKLSLAVLMLAAAFTACTKEEFAPTQDIQQDEFVGAKLVGSDLSVNFVRDGETKVDAYGNWEKGDEAGLGWVINGSVGAEQTADAPSNSNLYANHLFVKGDADFSTYGNVYEGWHFGYYPYAYAKRLGQPMIVAVNPEQKDKYEVDQFKNRLHLTARQFLSEKNNLDGRALVNTNFDLRRAVKTIKVTVKPDVSLQNEALQAMKITEIELSLPTEHTNSPFYSGNVELVLKDLAPVATVPGTGAYDEEQTLEDFYTSMSKVWANAYKKGATIASKSIKTSLVNASGINLTGNQVLRFYTLPFVNTSVGKAFAKGDIKFKVYTQAGFFTVAYKAKTAAGYDENIDGKNNEFIEKLVDAYTQEGNEGNVGYMRGWDLEKETPKAVLTLEFILTPGMFTEQLQDIRSESQWNEAVKVVDALGLDEVKFKVGKRYTGSKYVDWAFTDADNDGNLINLPKTAELTVEEAATNAQTSLILNKKDAEWPDAENLTVKTDIEVWSDLKVEGTMNVFQGKTIYNGATIYAGELAQIGIKPVATSDPATTINATFENILPAYSINDDQEDPIEGKVVVEYGAYVYPKTGKKGIISYDVESTTIEDIKKIKKLIAVEENVWGYAGINTLNLKTELDLNARAVEGVSNDDRYENTTITELILSSLASDFTVNLQGGSLVNKLSGPNTTVANVVAESGVNTLDNVVANNITVKSGATLNVNNTKTTLAKTYFNSGSIINKGTLNLSNVRLDVTNVTNNANSSITVGTGSCIQYHGTYTQNGSVSGSVNAGYASNIVVGTLNEFLSAVAKVDGATGSPTKVELASNITLDAANIGMDLTGVNFDGHGYVVSTDADATYTSGMSVFEIGKGTIKNVVFNAPKTNYDIKLTSNSEDNVTIEGCTFNTACAANSPYGKRGIFSLNYEGKVVVKNCTFDDKVYAFNFQSNITDLATAEFTNCNINGWLSGVASMTFTSCTFGKSGDYADFIPYDDATFNGCTFASNFAISLRQAKTLTFDNACVFGNKTITAPQDIKWSWNGGSNTTNTVTVKIKYGSNWNSWTANGLDQSTVEEDGITW